MNCTKLISIELPNVQTIGDSAFRECTELKTIKLGYSSNNLKLGKFVFDRCISLIWGYMPTLTAIGECCFSNCYKLNRIGSTPLLSSIGEDAFSNCYHLIDINIRNIEIDKNRKNQKHRDALTTVNKLCLPGSNSFSRIIIKNEADSPNTFSDLKKNLIDEQKQELSEDSKIKPIEEITTTIIDKLITEISEDSKIKLIEEITTTITDELKIRIAEDLTTDNTDFCVNTSVDEFVKSIIVELKTKFINEAKTSITNNLDSWITNELKINAADEFTIVVTNDFENSIVKEIKTKITDNMKIWILEELKTWIVSKIKTNGDEEFTIDLAKDFGSSITEKIIKDAITELKTKIIDRPQAICGDRYFIQWDDSELAHHIQFVLQYHKNLILYTRGILYISKLDGEKPNRIDFRHIYNQLLELQKKEDSEGDDSKRGKIEDEEYICTRLDVARDLVKVANNLNLVDYWHINNTADTTEIVIYPRPKWFIDRFHNCNIDCNYIPYTEPKSFGELLGLDDIFKFGKDKELFIPNDLVFSKYLVFENCVVKMKYSEIRNSDDEAIRILAEDVIDINHMLVTLNSFKNTEQLKHLSVNSNFDYRFLSYIPKKDFLILTVRESTDDDYYGFSKYITNDELARSYFYDRDYTRQRIFEDLEPWYMIKFFLERKVREYCYNVINNGRYIYDLEWKDCSNPPFSVIIEYLFLKWKIKNRDLVSKYATYYHILRINLGDYETFTETLINKLEDSMREGDPNYSLLDIGKFDIISNNIVNRGSRLTRQISNSSNKKLVNDIKETISNQFGKIESYICGLCESIQNAKNSSDSVDSKIDETLNTITKAFVETLKKDKTMVFKDEILNNLSHEPSFETVEPSEIVDFVENTHSIISESLKLLVSEYLDIRYQRLERKTVEREIAPLLEAVLVHALTDIGWLFSDYNQHCSILRYLYISPIADALPQWRFDVNMKISRIRPGTYLLKKFGKTPVAEPIRFDSPFGAEL